MSLMSSLGIDRLSPAEQFQLASEILSKLDDERDKIALTEPQRKELGRRVALLEANATGLSTWEEVEARVLAKLQQ
jgi:putative addiction module component (TIGR02574 family)